MILIASADHQVRRSWARALEKSLPTFELSDRSALELAVARSKPSVLLLHLALPQLGGLEGVSALRGLSPATQIILLSSAPEDREAIQALKLGVKGYCHSDIDPRLLVRAVKVVQGGEIWVGRKVIPDLIEEITSARQLRQNGSTRLLELQLDSLSPRELQIARLVGDGACNKEIAQKLKISESTVKAHMTAIFRKLKVHDRLRLALLVTESARNNH